MGRTSRYIAHAKACALRERRIAEIGLTRAERSLQAARSSRTSRYHALQTLPSLGPPEGGHYVQLVGLKADTTYNGSA